MTCTPRPLAVVQAAQPERGERLIHVVCASQGRACIPTAAKKNKNHTHRTAHKHSFHLLKLASKDLPSHRDINLQLVQGAALVNELHISFLS